MIEFIIGFCAGAYIVGFCWALTSGFFDSLLS